MTTAIKYRIILAPNSPIPGTLGWWKRDAVMTNDMTRQAETISRTVLLRVSPEAIRQTD